MESTSSVAKSVATGSVRDQSRQTPAIKAGASRTTATRPYPPRGIDGGESHVRCHRSLEYGNRASHGGNVNGAKAWSDEFLCRCRTHCTRSSPGSAAIYTDTSTCATACAATCTATCAATCAATSTAAADADAATATATASGHTCTTSRPILYACYRASSSSAAAAQPQCPNAAAQTIKQLGWDAADPLGLC